MKISRIWHGYTTPENADAYESLLRSEVFPHIQNRNITGFKSIQLLRRNINNETEFITIMEFDSIQAVKDFAGENYEQAVVPENARKVLKRFDALSQHYKVLIDV
jgi:heme-degrading monooxygenase HmoA